MGHLGQPVAGPGGDPLLVDVIVDHDAGAGRRDALLGPLITKRQNINMGLFRLYNVCLCCREVISNNPFYAFAAE